jgi:hypothetical protein
VFNLSGVNSDTIQTEGKGDVGVREVMKVMGVKVRSKTKYFRNIF